MRARTVVDAHAGLARAVTALGAASVASAVFVFLRGTFEFVQIRGVGVAVTLLLGALAVTAGRLARPALALAAGVGFLLAAAAQVLFWARGDALLGGDGSTVAWWLGLGAGLTVLGTADRLWPAPGDPEPSRRLDEGSPKEGKRWI